MSNYIEWSIRQKNIPLWKNNKYRFKREFEEHFDKKYWDYIKEIDNPDETYNKLWYDFSSLYEGAFPKLEIKIKQKVFINLWVTKGIMRFSKKKQLFNKFLISRAKENDVIYKAYKNLFETIRKKIEKDLLLWIIWKI